MTLRAARLSALQPIPEAANRFDQVARFAELRAMALHVHVHRTQLDVRRRVPLRLVQMRATLHASATLGENQQELVFGRREIDDASIAQYAMLGAIDRDRSDRENVGGAHTAGAEPAKNRVDAEHELLRAEGLREIVVSAEREAANAVLLFAAGSEHEHGDVAGRRLGAELLENVVAGSAGEHEIEHDERRRSWRA